MTLDATDDSDEELLIRMLQKYNKAKQVPAAEDDSTLVPAAGDDSTLVPAAEDDSTLVPAAEESNVQRERTKMLKYYRYLVPLIKKKCENLHARTGVSINLEIGAIWANGVPMVYNTPTWESWVPLRFREV